ncbi:MAG: hydroxymethylbilane synthase, partial [Nitrospinota bacterium]|nr:hydroxymethylbilane synthase [Nitrospinota bacterium]
MTDPRRLGVPDPAGASGPPESPPRDRFRKGGKPLRVGSRAGALAWCQAEGVRDALKALGVGVELVEIRTEGDRIQDQPLTAIGGKGVFTKEIEDALLAGRIDLAVHSLKDLPTDFPAGLSLASIPRREDPRDIFIAKDGATRLVDLPPGGRVGTGSLRRRAQLRAFRPDLEMVDIRGNLDTRLRKLDSGEMDGIVLAAAGFSRLGWKDRITEILST